MANLINQKWVFGMRAGLDFSTPIPTPTSGFSIGTGEGCASISDVNGNLLLYTDGNKVWDSTHNLMASGIASGLGGNTSSTQSAIIVPDPGNSQRYYIFTADGVTGGNNHLNGTRLDLSSSTWSPTPLSSLMSMPPTAGRSPTERVTAIQHANCVDYWVLTIVQQSPTPAPVPDPGNGPGIFRLFLVNSLGVQYMGETPMNRNVGDIGYLKASPNGRRLVVPNHPNNNVLVYNFDNALGVINIPSLVTITVPPLTSLVPPILVHNRAPYGAEFSPNGDVLYYSIFGSAAGSGTDNNGYIFQVDLTVPPVSTQIVAYQNPPGSTGYAIGALQLGMDGRIYVAKDQETSLGAILSPNVLGAGLTGCNQNMSFIAMATGTTCRLGLPNLLSNPCDCPCEAGCEADVNNANQILNGRAALKQFPIVANGQSLPASCQLAFTNASFAPVFTLRWGDGPADQFESDDLEVIYIQIHNPYRNLIYRDVKIFNIKITPNQTLPDGDDTVRIVPAVIDCFDEIQPCSHVSRDFALIIDHALVGTYHISFDYCIGEIAIVSPTDASVVFDIKVVAS